MRPILLDTCALIWLSNRDHIAQSARQAIDEAEATATPVVVSPISAWEIGSLVSRGRLTISVDPRTWFQTALDAGLELASMPAEVLIASSFLPSGDLRDPADRIIAATARHYRYRLMTRDRPLLAFGDEGHVETIPC